jgi:hypothetical protein
MLKGPSWDKVTLGVVELETIVPPELVMRRPTQAFYL